MVGVAGHGGAGGDTAVVDDDMEVAGAVVHLARFLDGHAVGRHGHGHAAEHLAPSAGALSVAVAESPSSPPHATSPVAPISATSATPQNGNVVVGRTAVSLVSAGVTPADALLSRP